jgi:hypothetical protein
MRECALDSPVRACPPWTVVRPQTGDQRANGGRSNKDSWAGTRFVLSTLKGAGAPANGVGERCGKVTREADKRMTGALTTSGALMTRSTPA